MCVWDPDTGEPLHRAIVWQDRRTAARCDELREAGHEELIRRRTGLVIDPYFSATKIAWLLESVDGLRARAEQGRAVFGTVDAWLIFKMTGEPATDPSNASRTMLFDIDRGRWDPELLELFGVPERALPEVRTSCGTIGVTRAEAMHGHRVPVTGAAGDQQAALFGQACLDPGLGKNTYGTGSFVLQNAGYRSPAAVEGLLSTVAWGIGDRLTYAVEAAIFVTGAAVQWLRDGLGIITQASETEALAASLEGQRRRRTSSPRSPGSARRTGIPYARGTIVGLTRGTGRAHLARATLESIAYQTVDAVRAIEHACGIELDRAARRRWRDRQRLADAVPGRCAGRAGRAARRSPRPRRSARPTSPVSGAGLWTVDLLRRSWRERRRYEPAMGAERREELLARWRQAIDRARGVGGRGRLRVWHRRALRWTSI